MESMTREERNAKVLARTSVFDLREASDEDLQAATEKLIASQSEISVVESGAFPNLVSFFLVESGANIYEVRRFESFVFCECEAFFYTQKACKHVAATFPPVCSKCGRASDAHSALCMACEMKSAPYLRQSSTKTPEKLGNIRI
ncbi:MAG TPA: hypothetical protein VIL74_08875 [Pyrinomonadaceae bacterium]|jgi:hypothetical protein